MRTRCLTTSQVSFQTITGRLSFLGAFQDLAANSYRSTSSIVISDIARGALYSLGPLSSILSGRGGKKVARSSPSTFSLSRGNYLNLLVVSYRGS